METDWTIFEFRHVKVNPTVNAHTVHLKNQKKVIVRNQNLPPGLNERPLQHYFKGPAKHHSLNFLNYMKRF